MTTLLYPHQRAPFTVHAQLPLFTPLQHNCCATYAHDFKWRIMQGASGGHMAIAVSAALSRGASAADAVEADET